jgi:5'-phosphate synthase pdxT subunit
MDITVERNAYGRQLDSFDVPITSQLFKNLRGVFIRAPRIKTIGPRVQVLATHGRDPVLVREHHMLGGAFHPELTANLEVHRYFVDMVKQYAQR